MKNKITNPNEIKSSKRNKTTERNAESNRKPLTFVEFVHPKQKRYANEYADRDRKLVAFFPDRFVYTAAAASKCRL